MQTMQVATNTRVLYCSETVDNIMTKNAATVEWNDQKATVGRRLETIAIFLFVNDS